VHPFLDIAAVQLQSKRSAVTPVEVTFSVAPGDDLIFIGNVRGTAVNAQKLFVPSYVKVEETDRNGLAATSKGGVEVGFSGGPALKTNKKQDTLGELVGITHSFDETHSDFVPLERAAPYFQRIGITIPPRGTVTYRDNDDYTSVTNELKRLEEFAASIQEEYKCTGTLESTRRLTIACGVQFHKQPPLSGRVAVAAVPMFRDAAFDNLSESERFAIDEQGRFKGDSILWFNNTSEKVDLTDEIDDIKLKYKNEKNVDMANAPLAGLEIISQVDAIRSKDFLVPPAAITLCFHIEMGKTAPGQEKGNTAPGHEIGNTAPGQECGKEFDYVRAHLPR
jgi:hypothetical protein